MADFNPTIVSQAFLDGQWKTLEQISNPAWCYVARTVFGGRLVMAEQDTFVLFNKKIYNLSHLNGKEAPKTKIISPNVFVEKFNLKLYTYRNVIKRAQMACDISTTKRSKAPENIEQFKQLEQVELQLWQKLFSNKIHRKELLLKLSEYFTTSESKEEQKYAEKDWENLFSPKPTMKELRLIRLTDAPRSVVKYVLTLTTNQTKWHQSVVRAQEKLQKLKNQLVVANLKLRQGYVSKVNPSAFLTIPYDDLLQESSFGIMRAVERFDYKKGFTFSTFCAHWIRHAVERYLQNHKRPIRVPVHTLKGLQKIADFSREFFLLHGRAPTNDEIHKVVKLRYTPDDINYRYLSFDEPIHNSNEGLTYTEILGGDEEDSPEYLNNREEFNFKISQVLKILTLSEKAIINQRFGFGGEELSLAAIGKQFNLSRERIRQIQVQTIEKLRKEMFKQGIAA